MWTAVSSSTGIEKKPWIWPWWRSIVSTRSAPATVSMSAIRRAVIGTRGWAFLSGGPAGRGLDQKDVLLPNILEDADKDVLVRELEGVGLAHPGLEVAADVLRQWPVGVARVDA